MQAPQSIVTFTEGERPLGERLLKIAVEIDRVEGYSEPHAAAIARMAEKLGAQLGMHGSDLTALKFAALAHDIGERAMKRNYLLRPDALTWEERLDLWRHPILGEQAAGELRLSRHAQLLIRWHHESWNGQGYPDGLGGREIPLGARILRVVDSYFALIARRPHRGPVDPLDAEQILADLAGIEFDPRIVKELLLTLAEERKERETPPWANSFVVPLSAATALMETAGNESGLPAELADEAGREEAEPLSASDAEEIPVASIPLASDLGESSYIAPIEPLDPAPPDAAPSPAASEESPAPAPIADSETEPRTDH